jgi:short-subunit dehydrogenase
MGVTVTVLCPAGMPTTPECVRAIHAQGLLGQLTTQNTGSVANLTLNAALKGEAVCIPGHLNQFLQFTGSRWKTAQRKQASHLSGMSQAATTLSYE